MATQIHLLRHAESYGNYYHKRDEKLPRDVIGDSLSKFGESQALELKKNSVKWLDQYHTIYCSPFNRAIQTIGPSLLETNRRATIMPDLAEFKYLGGSTLVNICHPNNYQNLLIPVQEGSSRFIESFNGKQERPAADDQWPLMGVTAQLMRLDMQIRNLSLSGEKFLFVCHGNLIRKLLEHLMCQFHVRFQIDNCSLTSLAFNNHGRLVRIKGVNEKIVRVS